MPEYGKMIEVRHAMVEAAMDVLKKADFDEIEQTVVTHEVSGFLLALTLLGLSNERKEEFINTFCRYVRDLLADMEANKSRTLQ